MSQVGRRQILRSALSALNSVLAFSAAPLPVTALAYEQNQRKFEASRHLYHEPEAYEIYTAALNLDMNRYKEKRIVIASETTRSDHACCRPENEWPRSLVPTVVKYKQLLGTKWLLQRRFDLHKPYELVSSERLASLRDDDFASAFPGADGYIALSPVSFNQDRTLALVFIGRLHFARGAGELCVYRKNGSVWLSSKMEGFGCGWAADSGNTVRL